MPQKSFWSFIAAPMSPLIFSLPVMYAVVGFCSPATIFWKLSSLAEKVQSASLAPSVTVIVPSTIATVHVAPGDRVAGAQLLVELEP